MAAAYEADQAVWDCARVLRLPGFSNNKYAEKEWVRELPGERSGEVFTPADFPTYPELERQIARGESRQLPAGHKSRSEQDWGQTLRRLECGENSNEVREWLAAQRQDKARPDDYARRTVEKAIRTIDGRSSRD